MTMQFRLIKDAIEAKLVAAAASQYVVVGYPGQTVSAESIKGTLRTVRVYSTGGSFDKGHGSINGPVSHEPTYHIELSVAESSKADLTVLDNVASTEAQKATALLNSVGADKEADDSMDAFIDLVWNVLMDAENKDFGLTGDVANRWVADWQKGNISRSGQLVMVTSVINLTLRTTEEVTGLSGLPMLDITIASEVNGEAAITGTKVDTT
jgi:hypothetical protein